VRKIEEWFKGFRFERAFAVLASVTLAACAHNATSGTTTQPISYSAIVDAYFRGNDGDSIGGVPAFHTLGASLSAVAPIKGSKVIFIRNGRYHEKLTVTVPGVTLLGEDRDSVFITFDAASDTPNPAGGTYGMRASWTLRIAAPDFRAENLTIENAFDYNANAAKDSSDPTKFRNPQGVALMTDVGSDRATFINVRFLGHQDTLFANVGRHYFYHCEIQGNVDFIFGAGRAVFEECEIVSLDRHSKTNNGYITAADTPDSARFGFLILRSRLQKESPAMAPSSVTLGRPWHPFADPHSYPSVVYMDTWMDDHIGTKGWDRMSSVDSTGTRIWYEPESARFAEFGSIGPGARGGAMRRQLTGAEAAAWTPLNVLEGWIPPRTTTQIKNRPGAGEPEEQHAFGRTLEEMFAGKYPGLEVLRLPGGGITFRIRGPNSIFGPSEPLIIVDGVELQAGGGGLQFLSPEDIEKIEVIKDPGLTAIYGSKGGNGVIVITRKKAR